MILMRPITTVAGSIDQMCNYISWVQDARETWVCGSNIIGHRFPGKNPQSEEESLHLSGEKKPEKVMQVSDQVVA